MRLVQYAESGGVARITLNRPEVANAFDRDTTREFVAAVCRAQEASEVRSILLSGSGARFCAGGDVESFASADDQPAYLHRLAVELDAAFRQLGELAKPVVAAVHGAVAGAGLALILSCDVVVAAPETKFVFAYPAVGLTPDCGLSYLLPRAIGQQRALAFALLGKAAVASQAVEWGLISEIATDPLSRAKQIATEIADGPAAALGQARRLLRRGWALDRMETGKEEARTIAEAVAGAEAQTLIRNFANR
jgi:2-(1,2-epoxy-1,2-dihydrophenyl)acetyl-CoA isomerase